MWPFLLNPAQLGMPFVSDALHWLMLASLQGAFALVLAFGATRFKNQTSAAQRHFVWVLAFSALLLLPILNLTLPNQVLVTPAPTVSQPNPKQGSKSAPDLSNASFASPTNNSSESDLPPTIVTPLMASFGWQDAKQLVISSSSLIIVSLWLWGIAIMVLRLLVNLIQLRQLERNSQPLETESWNEQARSRPAVGPSR